MLDSWALPVIEAGMGVLALCLLILPCLACEAGFQLGRWRGRRIARNEAASFTASELNGPIGALDTRTGQIQERIWTQATT